MKSIVKKAREIVTQLYERNMVAWNDLDREVVFAIQALIAEVQRMEALAQPEQEPVAWEQFYPDIGKPQIALNAKVVGYVAPQRTWVGLTEEDRAEILNRKWWNFEDEFDVDGFLRLAEETLKEKNI